MQEAEKDPWVVFLEGGVLWAEGPGGIRVRELVLKVRHTGILAVVKVKRSQEDLIAFKGGATLRSVAGAVRNLIKDELTRWRPDEWP